MRRASARRPARAMRVPSPRWRRPTGRSPRSSGPIPPSRRGANCSTPHSPTSMNWLAWRPTMRGRCRTIPARLAELERRRDQLYGLFQKHGADSAAVLEARATAAAELDLLDTADLDLRALGTRRQAADSGCCGRRWSSSSPRRTAATDRLARAVNKWLPRLGLPGGKFRASARATRRRPMRSGRRRRRSWCSSMPASTSGRSRKVASGGELSRLMLALKVVLAKQDHVPTLVFDEVDQGIGGEIGVQVGEALAEVAGASPGAGDHAPAADRGARRSSPRGIEGARSEASRRAMSRRFTARIAYSRWPECWADPESDTVRTPRAGTAFRARGREGMR